MRAAETCAEGWEVEDAGLVCVCCQPGVEPFASDRHVCMIWNPPKHKKFYITATSSVETGGGVKRVWGLGGSLFSKMLSDWSHEP